MPHAGSRSEGESASRRRVERIAADRGRIGRERREPGAELERERSGSARLLTVVPVSRSEPDGMTGGLAAPGRHGVGEPPDSASSSAERARIIDCSLAMLAVAALFPISAPRFISSGMTRMLFCPVGER